MNKLITILLLSFCVCTVQAQNDSTVSSLDEAGQTSAPLGLQADTATFALQPLGLPLTSRGTIAHYPAMSYYWSGFDHWSLHSGLNVSLSASAIWGLGHRGGSGFSNSLSLMYAHSLTPRLSYAIGGYLTRLDWRSRSLTDAGLTGLLNYRFSDRWDGTVFFQKSLAQPHRRMPLFMSADLNDKIGASLRYSPNPMFYVEVSVWNEWQPAVPVFQK